MAQVEERLKELGLELPEAPEPIANYVGAVSTGNLVFLSGRGPRRDGRFVSTGKLGRDVTVEAGYEAARLTVLNLLASLKGEIGNLDRVRQIVKLVGMVSCDPSFTQHSQVINGGPDSVDEQADGERGKRVAELLQDDDEGGNLEGHAEGSRVHRDNGNDHACAEGKGWPEDRSRGSSRGCRFPALNARAGSRGRALSVVSAHGDSVISTAY